MFDHQGGNASKCRAFCRLDLRHFSPTYAKALDSSYFWVTMTIWGVTLHILNTQRMTGSWFVGWLNGWADRWADGRRASYAHLCLFQEYFSSPLTHEWGPKKRANSSSMQLDQTIHTRVFENLVISYNSQVFMSWVFNHRAIQSTTSPTTDVAKPSLWP